MESRPINTHVQMQQLARQTLKALADHLHPGMTLYEICSFCEEMMLQNGADSFWYYDIGALVYARDQTRISISGKDYKTPDYALRENDLITIDLSPQKDQIWGDYARTLILESGRCISEVSQIQNEEWRQGLETENFLHRRVMEILTPQLTFEKLWMYFNQLIHDLGFQNLDFNGNLGHSIAKNKVDRIYIEKGNHTLLAETGLFTFEPHIAREKSKFGFKKENIIACHNGEFHIL